MRKLFFIAFLVFLTSCAQLNEGATDYRVYDPNFIQYYMNIKNLDSLFTKAIEEANKGIKNDKEIESKPEVVKITNIDSNLYKSLKADLLALSCQKTETCDPQNEIKYFKKAIEFRLQAYLLTENDKKLLTKYLFNAFKKYIYEEVSIVSSSNKFQYRYFKSKADPDLIFADDSITVSLLQAFICDFKEIGMPKFNYFVIPELTGHCNDLVDPKGEILIIARIIERNNSGTTYNYADIKDKGRVVFYSDDVKGRGQYLNFSNLPIYGPITYNGKPLYLEFNILELDNAENEKTKALLNTLAELGSSAYPPAAPILGVLNSLGASLLSGDQDDLEFRYHMELVPATKKQSNLLSRPFIKEGVYVFLRNEDRVRDNEWDGLTFDAGNGRLMNGGESYRGSTYLVVQIAKGDNPVDLDTAQTVADFLTKNMNGAKNNINLVLENLEKTKTILLEKEKFRRLNQAMDAVSNEDFNRETQVGQQQLSVALVGLCEALINDSKSINTITHDQISGLLTKLSNSKNVKNKLEVIRAYITPKCNEKNELETVKSISNHLWDVQPVVP